MRNGLAQPTPREIINVNQFLLATRDSGYGSLDVALAELIDNSLQASATEIEVSFSDDPPGTPGAFVSVLDNGCGMRSDDLAQALRFGGSNRFGDRSGLGRFGMGLPNSSLSQGRRVDVYAWQNPRRVWHAYLDLDEALDVGAKALNPVRRSSLPQLAKERGYVSGTLVSWSRLDRVEGPSWRGISTRIRSRLGRKFRYFLWEGRQIILGGEPLLAHDPLYLSGDTVVPWVRATPYAEPLEYEVLSEAAHEEPVSSTIRVRFSEIPVDPLSGLSGPEKRRFGIAGGAGVSFIRAGREIDYGWFFFDKRRENYDDWWRCEIRFEPVLDELFGISHTKQGIRPTDPLRAILTDDLSRIARTLNSRVRAAHRRYGTLNRTRAAEGAASLRDQYLPPLKPTPSPLLPCTNPGELAPPTLAVVPRLEPLFSITSEELPDRTFYHAEWRNERTTIILNEGHPFCRSIFSPLMRECNYRSIAESLKLFLLALGRAELLAWSESEREAIRRFVNEWSRAASVFLERR